MQAGWYWVCPYCRARNKAFTPECRGCGREREPGAVAVERATAWDRFRPARPARWFVIGALAAGIVVAVLLVRTFRAPGLEAFSPAEQMARARSPQGPVPAVTPPAPAMQAPYAVSTAAPPPAVASTLPSQSLPDEMSPMAAATAAVDEGVRAYAPAAARPLDLRRTYTDADLAAYAASRGVAATRDPRYLLALRQRRVEDLRARLDAARSPDERDKLRVWLESAQRDLADAQRIAGR